MTITLNARTEQRIQRQIDLGHGLDPAEVIAHALNLLEAEEDWLQANKDAINERLEHSMAQAARGQVYPWRSSSPSGRAHRATKPMNGFQITGPARPTAMLLRPKQAVQRELRIS